MDYKEFNAEFYQLKMQYEDGDRSSELLNNIRSLIENAKEEISENHPEILSMGYLWFTICEAYRKMTDLAERLTEIVGEQIYTSIIITRLLYSILTLVMKLNQLISPLLKKLWEIPNID